jgi:two-component system phosphate regulon sensor histidine kinase PhoR
MPQIVWTVGVHGKATYFNRRWFEYTGVNPEETDAHMWRSVLHPDDLPQMLSSREATLESGEPFEIEYRLRAASGGYRWHLGRRVPVRGESGEIEFWIGTATDIDAHKRSEERHDLVATVSHELRTPLAAIYGSALTLRRSDVALELELRDKLLEVIAAEAEHLTEIVDDLLLMSQLDSGKLAVRIEPCDPIEIVRQEVESARTHVPDHVELAFEAPSTLPSVAADPSQLRQVLSNLLDNAVKYSPEGGEISVELSSRNRHVRFAVRDAGLGVPPVERERIFEKFYRLDAGTSRRIAGTGLGLYICRELVRRVDGRIWVEHGAGAGSTFVVEIPQEQAPAKGGYGAPAREAARSR